MARKSYYNINVKHEGYYYVFNTKTTSLVKFNEKEFGLYETMAEVSDYKLKKNLIQEGVLTELNHNDEKKLTTFKPELQKWNGNFLSLTILPTTDCNFNCYYCYEKGIERIDMSDKIIDNLILYIKNRYNKRPFRNIKLTWIGGEPLMKINIIKKIYEKLIAFKEEVNNLIILPSTIISNGYYIDDDMIRDLLELNVGRVQITLDGDKKSHNIIKPNSFDKILNGIKLLIDNNIFTLIRVNIDKNSMTNFNSLVNQVKDKIGRSSYSKKYIIRPFKTYFFHQGCKEKDLLNQATPFEYEKMMKENSELIYENNSNNFIQLNNIDKAKVFGDEEFGLVETYCSAAGSNSFTINSDGNVYKCWDHVGRDEMIVDSLIDDRTEVMDSNMYKWLTYKAPNECLECQLFPICGSTCPYKIMQGQFSCDKLKVYKILELKIKKLIELRNETDK